MIDAIDLDHVAVAAESAFDAWPRYAGDLAGRWLAGGATVGFASAQVVYANGMKVEVLEPHMVEANDFLRRFLDHRGPGPHHMTFKVRDIAAALGVVEEAGYRPINVDLRDPMWKEAFIHPKDAPGVVVQLAQSEGEWVSPAPQGFPAPARPTAHLVHVTHAVADMKEGLRMFRDLLAGAETGEGSDEAGRWVDLAWPGPGRVRLLEPAAATPARAWIGDGAGRIHHLAFACDDPTSIPGANVRPDGLVEVPPEHNLGVRLVVAPTPQPFADLSGG
jgi:methylmalonyl-CoA/ethylmalonyl-CoA epimerase